MVAEGLEKLAPGAETYSSVGRWAWEATGRSRTRPAKLSDAERERRTKVAEWRRAVRAVEAVGKRPPAKPRGLSLDPLPSASATRRRRRTTTAASCPPGARRRHAARRRATAGTSRPTDITDADVADQQPFHARLDDLAGVLTAPPGERLVLVAHHAPFDVGVLHLEHQRAGRALPDVEVLDTSRWPATSSSAPAATGCPTSSRTSG